MFPGLCLGPENWGLREVSPTVEWYEDIGSMYS